jgi:hypothetical protein
LTDALTASPGAARKAVGRSRSISSHRRCRSGRRRRRGPPALLVSGELAERGASSARDVVARGRTAQRLTAARSCP